MDGRMDGQMDAWVDGGRDRQGQIDGYMNKKITHDKLLKKKFQVHSFHINVYRHSQLQFIEVCA